MSQPTRRPGHRIFETVPTCSVRSQPSKYHDTYREDLMKLVEEKVAAGQVNKVGSDEELPVPSPLQEGVVDLVALLRRSIDARPADSKPAKSAAVRKERGATPGERRVHRAGPRRKVRPLRRRA